MKEVISIISAKGEVGKTSIAVNVANYLAECGIKILLVDGDLNTYGASIFFKLRKRLTEYPSNCVTLQTILEKYINEELTFFNRGEENEEFFETGEYYKIRENLDFIPAINELKFKNYIKFSDHSIENIVSSLYKLVGFWSKKYEVIILDHSAGYNEFIEQMCEISTSILIVGEDNPLSNDTTHSLMEQVYKLTRPIKLCINRLPDEEYNEVCENKSDKLELIPRFYGFEYNEIFAGKIQKGKLINMELKSCKGFWKYYPSKMALSRISKEILYENRMRIEAYEEKANEYFEQKTQIEKEEKLQRNISIWHFVWGIAFFITVIIMFIFWLFIERGVRYILFILIGEIIAEIILKIWWSKITVDYENEKQDEYNTKDVVEKSEKD